MPRRPTATTATTATAATTVAPTQVATIPAKRTRSPRQTAEDRRQRERTTEPLEEEKEEETAPERVIRTTSVARAALGALQIEAPTGEEVERHISQALVDLINRNRQRDEPGISALPKLGTILARLNILTQWRNGDGVVAMDTDLPNEERLTVTIDHDGAFPNGRIGKTMSILLLPGSTMLSATEAANLTALLPFILRTKQLCNWTSDVDRTLGSFSYGHLIGGTTHAPQVRQLCSSGE